MLREHKARGRWLRFYEPETSSTISLAYGEYPYVEGTIVQYSYDGCSWSEYPSEETLTISAQEPEKKELYFRAYGDNREYFDDTIQNTSQMFGKFSVSAKCKCDGDVMCLLDSEGRATVAYEGVFLDMFRGTHITTAPYISASVLRRACYHSMFYECTDLQYPMSELPAVAVEQESYESMFEGCSSLLSVPELRFTSVAAESCAYMFKGCALIESVYLRPYELANSCFYEMFYNCIHLNYIRCNFIKWPEYRPEYHTSSDTPRDAATYNWTYNVAATGTFVRDYRLPLYINNKPGQDQPSADPNSGEIYNWDNDHSVPYETLGMWHFDPWVGKESHNETTIPPCAVRYRTVPLPKGGELTVTFNFLSQYAITGDAEEDFVSEDVTEQAEKLGNHYWNGTTYNHAKHAGRINIDEYNQELYHYFGESHSLESLYMTPDKNVTIDWGDGQKTVIPACRTVNPEVQFQEDTDWWSQEHASDTIGGIFRHTYSGGTEGENFIITVCSDDITADDEFYSVIPVEDTYNVSAVYFNPVQFKGCMPPLCALHGSHIEALLTPLLPIYGGEREYGLYYPIPFMFYGNDELISVPHIQSDSAYSFMFAKNKLNLDHAFGAARMFEGCTNLIGSPILEVCEINMQDPNGLSLFAPAPVYISSFEGFLKNCTSVKSVTLPFENLNKPFMLAEFASGASSLKRIECMFSKWPNYTDPDSEIGSGCCATWLWTKNVYDEYGDGGVFDNPMNLPTGLPVSSVQSDQANDEHEYNPWKPKTIQDDWYLTFTNEQSSTKTVTLKNHRRLFASLVNNSRVLDVQDSNGMIHRVSCHIHLLQYRKKLSGASAFGSWLDITDDDLSSGIIHAGQYQSSLEIDGSGDYKFIWSIDLAPGEALQMRGIPCTVGRYRITRTENSKEIYFYTPDISMWEKGLKFIDTDYFGYGGESYYFETFKDYLDENNHCEIGGWFHSAYADLPYCMNRDYETADRYYCSYTFFLGNRMFTGINLHEKYYQFFDCGDLTVSGFIDTFFDYLDIMSKEFSAPPLTYYRLFKGTGILTAPNIFATSGPDRGEFAECFMNCTKLTAPALMNISDETIPINPSAKGPAKPLRFNYNAACFYPKVNYPAFNGWSQEELNGIISEGLQGTIPGSAGSTNSFTGSTRTCIAGNYYNVGAELTPGAQQRIWDYVNVQGQIGEGAFEGMYEGCTNLVWPTINSGSGRIPRQLSLMHRVFKSKSFFNDTANRMFKGCTSIGTFGLVSYSKQALGADYYGIFGNIVFAIIHGIDYNREEYKGTSGLPNYAFREMFSNCSANENTDYLWNCYYTCASLKSYTNGGNADSLYASWQGTTIDNGPYSRWLQGTNIGKIITNCADRDGQTDDVFSIARGVSHCGTCDNDAWHVAHTAHSGEPGLPDYSYNKTWPRYNSSPFKNPYMMTWRRGSPELLEDTGAEIPIEID